MSKTRWTLLTLSGIIFILKVNIWMAKRDIKGLQMEGLSQEVIYKQLPVIPFTNLQ